MGNSSAKPVSLCVSVVEGIGRVIYDSSTAKLFYLSSGDPVRVVETKLSSKKTAEEVVEKDLLPEDQIFLRAVTCSTGLDTYLQSPAKHLPLHLLKLGQELDALTDTLLALCLDRGMELEGNEGAMKKLIMEEWQECSSSTWKNQEGTVFEGWWSKKGDPQTKHSLMIFHTSNVPTVGVWFKPAGKAWVCLDGKHSDKPKTGKAMKVSKEKVVSELQGVYDSVVLGKMESESRAIDFFEAVFQDRALAFAQWLDLARKARKKHLSKVLDLERKKMPRVVGTRQGASNPQRRPDSTPRTRDPASNLQLLSDLDKVAAEVKKVYLCVCQSENMQNQFERCIYMMLKELLESTHRSYKEKLQGMIHGLGTNESADEASGYVQDAFNMCCNGGWEDIFIKPGGLQDQNIILEEEEEVPDEAFDPFDFGSDNEYDAPNRRGWVDDLWGKVEKDFVGVVAAARQSQSQSLRDILKKLHRLTVQLFIQTPHCQFDVCGDSQHQFSSLRHSSEGDAIAEGQDVAIILPSVIQAPANSYHAQDLTGDVNDWKVLKKANVGPKM